jgi:membrane protein required for colicin V production
MQFIDSYNLIDVFIVGTILITLVLGLWKGFVRTLTALASLVVGVVLAVRCHGMVAPYLGKISSLDPQISMILSMIIVFILVQVAFVLIRRLLDKLLDLTHLTWLDRVLGAGIGAAAGFLVVASAVEVMLMGVPEWPLVKTSKLVVPVDRLAEKAVMHAPRPAKEQWASLMTKWKGVQDSLPQAPHRQSAASTPLNAAPPGPAK